MSSELPLRVGFVLHGLQVAGAEMLVLQIIQRLRGQIQPTVFCLDSVGSLSHHFENLDVDVIALGRRPGWDLSVAWRMARHIRRLDLQILHAHQYSPFFYGTLAKLFAGKAPPVIFTEHGRHFPDRVSKWRRAGNRLLLDRFADAINAVSKFSADSLACRDGFRRRRIEIIENGIDPDRFNLGISKPVDLDPGRRYVVNVARFHPVKDHATLIKGFELVANQLADVDLLLVGDGPLRGELESVVLAFHLENRVHFLGIRNDISGILRASKVFVLTSLSEGAPLTLLEAMAVGLPVVVTAVGGMPEIVHNRVEGLLAPRQDAPSIAAALIYLLENPADAAAMGSAGARTIRNRYTIDRTVKRYSALYSRLCGRA
jgi:glycosyltransferase involved in cell wall biosynthesis